jgi:hypothetical protein
VKKDFVIRNEAANRKIRLLNRGVKIRELAATIGLAKSGMAPDIKPQRLETIEQEFEVLTTRQLDEATVYATLRWVLDITEEIEPNNLGLDR